MMKKLLCWILKTIKMIIRRDQQMNEKLLDFLESSTTAWNNLFRSAKKPIPIFTFIDPLGGTWNLKALTGPCGGPLESGHNQYRTFWYCPLHESEGTLVNQLGDNSFCWLPPLKEVGK
jgi:hypothetical protein